MRVSGSHPSLMFVQPCNSDKFQKFPWPTLIKMFYQVKMKIYLLNCPNLLSGNCQRNVLRQHCQNQSSRKKKIMFDLTHSPVLKNINLTNQIWIDEIISVPSSVYFVKRIEDVRRPWTFHFHFTVKRIQMYSCFTSYSYMRIYGHSVNLY